MTNTSAAIQVSDDCSKFSVGNNAYVKGNNTNYSITTGNIAGSSVIFDQNFNYAFADGSIWKYSSTNSSYQRYSNNSINSSFTTAAILKSYNTSLVLYQLNSSNALLNAYVDSGNSLSLISSISASSFASTPKIALSPQLTLAAIYGVSSSNSSTSIIAFNYIDYSAKTVQSITFPT